VAALYNIIIVYFPYFEKSNFKAGRGAEAVVVCCAATFAALAFAAATVCRTEVSNVCLSSGGRLFTAFLKS